MSQYPNLVTFLSLADAATLDQFADQIPTWIKSCEENYLDSIKSTGLRLDNEHIKLAEDRKNKLIELKKNYNVLEDYANFKVSQQLDLLDLSVPSDSKKVMGE